MRGVSEFPEVFLHREFVDFRKSINGLCVIVEQEMALSPFSEALFVFCNKRRDKLKILYWDATGFCLWYKRLEQAKFHWPRKCFEPTVALSAEQLQWLLQGLNIEQLIPHKPLIYRASS